jgi:hypothetical protein
MQRKKFDFCRKTKNKEKSVFVWRTLLQDEGKELAKRKTDASGLYFS